MRIFAFTALLILSSPFALSAQGNHDCSDHDCFHAFVISKPFSHNPDTTALDTNIRFFYEPNRFTANILFPALAGTTGHPAVDLFRRFRPQNNNLFYHNPYESYQLNTETLPIVITDRPLTEWYYLVGAHNEQIFRAMHAQNAGRNLNFGLDISYINSQGAYAHEQARASHAGFYFQYRDPVLPFENDLLLLFNRATTDENGGISDPEWFVDAPKINRQLNPVWVYSATNTHKAAELVLRNRWYPGRGSRVRSQEPPDQPNDTIETVILPARKVEQHFALNFTWQQQRFLYRDTDPFNTWYPIVRYDTTVTHDTSGFRAFTTDLAYHMVAWQRIRVAAGVMFTLYRNHDTLTPAGKGSITEPYTRWEFLLVSGLTLDAGASLRFDPDFGAAHSLTSQLRWTPKGNVSVQVHLRDWTAFPLIQDVRHSSNHFYWINEMKVQHFSQLNPVVTLLGKFPLAVEGRVTRIANLIYYDTRAIPVQHDGTVVLWQLLLSGEWSRNRLVVDHTTGLQRASDENLLRQPHLLSKVMAGYRFRLFDGKIQAMGGFVFHGTTKAYRDEYMPATRVFYHTQRAPVNQYAWADPFLSLILKKARFLLTYQHATAWIAGFGQFELPGYPMQDPAFKMAVSWRFMD